MPLVLEKYGEHIRELRAPLCIIGVAKGYSPNPMTRIRHRGYPDYHTWLVGLPPTLATADCWMGTLVYSYDIEGPMQGICLKVIVPIGE